MNELPSQIEALLFTEGGSLSVKKLASLLSVKDADIRAALPLLAQTLQGRGLGLVYTDTEATLCVSKEQSPTVKGALQKDLDRDIGDAGLEVLAVILYRGASTRSQVDYIRGVNTGSTIRNLLARGLLERVGNPDDGREYLYRPTTELLAHLGVGAAGELPDHQKIVAELAAFESTQHKEESHDTE